MGTGGNPFSTFPLRSGKKISTPLLLIPISAAPYTAHTDRVPLGECVCVCDDVLYRESVLVSVCDRVRRCLSRVSVCSECVCATLYPFSLLQKGRRLLQWHDNDDDDDDEQMTMTTTTTKLIATRDKWAAYDDIVMLMMMMMIVGVLCRARCVGVPFFSFAAGS